MICVGLWDGFLIGVIGVGCWVGFGCKMVGYIKVWTYWGKMRVKIGSLCGWNWYEEIWGCGKVECCGENGRRVLMDGVFCKRVRKWV